MALTTGEEQTLKSGLRNANTAIQRLRNQISDLESTVRNQNVDISILDSNTQDLSRRLRHLEENAVIRS